MFPTRIRPVNSENDVWMIQNSELERMWEEVVISLF
jgi:hypothetical protein